MNSHDLPISPKITASTLIKFHQTSSTSYTDHIDDNDIEWLVDDWFDVNLGQYTMIYHTWHTMTIHEKNLYAWMSNITSFVFMIGYGWLSGWLVVWSMLHDIVVGAADVLPGRPARGAARCESQPRSLVRRELQGFREVQLWLGGCGGGDGVGGRGRRGVWRMDLLTIF